MSLQNALLRPVCTISKEYALKLAMFKIGMGRQDRYLGIESILVKYRDKILQPPLRLPTHIMEGRVKILETYPKYEEIISFFPYFRPFADCYIYLFIWGFTSLSTLYRSYHDG